MDEPLADPAAIALYFVSQTAAKHVKVAMSGEGADEFFGGYNIYREPLDLAEFQKLPSGLRKGFANIANAIPFKFKGKNVLFFLVILTLIVPAETIIIPLYNRFTSMGMIDTIWPVVILSICGLGLKNGLYIYLMQQFFRGLPKELEQSAYIDGAGPLRAFWSIMLPNASNMMITVFLFSFTWQWTDTTYNAMLCPNLNILANVVTSVASGVEDKIQAAAIEDTATLLVILPLLIVFLFAQRYFIQSIERSGLVE